VAPIYENANVAADHQQLTMMVMKRVAAKYGMECLLHEKPFAGVNGSGKHCNWSLGSSDPGQSAGTWQDAARKHAVPGVLCRRHPRPCTSTPALASRCGSCGQRSSLGCHEAPPAIISIFLGEQLADVFEQIKKSGSAAQQQATGCDDRWRRHAASLPEGCWRPQPPRRPFAFTGNKFEFRAVGSGQSLSGPLVALNTIMTESLDHIATELGKGTGGDPAKLNGAVSNVAEVDHQRARPRWSSTATATRKNGIRKRPKRGLPKQQADDRRTARDHRSRCRRDVRQVQGSDTSR